LTEFWNIFTYSSIYISTMIKWIVSFDSVYQIDPMNIPHNLFNNNDDNL
jgi:hypothetical protein